MSFSRTINELVEYLNVCRDAYYNLNKPIITDRQYDDLFDELVKLEEESGIILSNSPTQTVGYTAVSEFKKVKHYKPLLSLDKTKSYDDIVKFQNGKNVLYMHKLDGLTIQLTYEDGKLTLAETRGDGVIGEDITNNAKTFIGVPKQIPVKGTIRITGEAIINKDDFDRINESLSNDAKYANPRNLASGSVRQLDSKICASRKVRFIVWNANDLSSNGTMLDGLLNAYKYGFTIVEYWDSKEQKDSEYVKTTFTNMKGLAEKRGIPIDGIVVTFNDIKYGESLGRTSHHFKNGIAFKFYDEGDTAIIEDVEYTIGKTGVLTPTAVFSPVELCGTTVTRASLHNISIMKQLNINIGDEVEVYKANEIIPQIRTNNTKHSFEDAYRQTIPLQCPYCGSNTKIDTTIIWINKSRNQKKEVSVLKCTNTECKGKLLKKFTAFVSKQAMDIKGLSEATIQKFIDLGYLKTYSDIYTVCNTYKNDICSMSGFGEKVVSNLIDAVEASKNTTLDRVLTALNIEGVGTNVAKVISDHFSGDVEKLEDSIREGTLYSKLSFIHGLGDYLATNFSEYFNDKDNLSEFNNLLSYLNLNKVVEQKIGNALEGKSFVITGSLTTYKNREEFVNIIKANGGTVDSSVKKTTSYLINNDVTSNSSKNKKAKELGVEIISESDFNDMLIGNVIQPKKNTKLF